MTDAVFTLDEYQSRRLLDYLLGIVSLLFGQSKMSGADPLVSVSSLEDEKIFLLRHTDANFDTAWKHGRAKEFDEILPYTVAIWNQSDREIIAYVVTWDCTARDGSVSVSSRIVHEFSNLRPGTGLTPGKIEPVAIPPMVESGIWSPDMSLAIENVVASFRSTEMTHLSLDGVMFADGTVIGPNRSRNVERWRAWLKAEEEVFSNVALLSVDRLKNYLSMAGEPAIALYNSARNLSREIPDPGILALMLDRSQDPREYLSLAKGYYALSALREIEQTGTSTLQNNIRNTLLPKRYPGDRSKERDK
ncbi:MAG: hypothetical protein ACKV2U_08905 [Bryobacteraceae bacterium]